MADEDTTETDTAPAVEETPPAPPVEPTEPAPDEAEKPATVKPDDLQAAALRKANREAAERRQEIKRLQGELDAMKVASASEAEKALIEARLDAEKKAEARWKPALVTVRAEAALSSAGCRDADDRDLLLGKIDLTKVELDESGRIVSGLDEQVADLKERHAKLFAEPKPAVPSARTVGAGDKTAPPVKKSVGEQLAARLTGQR